MMHAASGPGILAVVAFVALGGCGGGGGGGPAPPSGPGGIVASPPVLSLGGIGPSAAQQLRISQPSYSGMLAVSGCSANATLSATSGPNPLTITVTPQALGSCSLSVLGGNYQSATIPVSVSTSAITIQ
ncbi:MAG: hypothetical protein KGM44_03020 [bacterium]|nr:hypothetical protein [bacterium]